MAGTNTGSVKTKDRLSTYFRGVKSELRKVIWPNRKELLNYTGVVIFISVLVAIIVYVLDLILGGILSFII
ncbi:preprotein translocase subunit SecE [Gudongella sp. DL1XJH-153]|uniref:preprotein translocase subunit SecE n=1 Tax=Gudongella sp. DL1XJH-153 TaxID=3409804 RepID=UPI003BB7A0D0